MNQALVTFEVLAIIAICVVSYFIISPRLAEPDVAQLSWGPFVQAAFPSFLAIFGVIGSVVLIKVSAGGLNQK